MPRTVEDCMTRNPTTLDGALSIGEAARTMRDRAIGYVIVSQADRVLGVVTDRDIVVRATAENRSPDSTPVSEVCSADLVTISPSISVEEAGETMKHYALRRLPVVDEGTLVGVISLGDLAREREADSVLAGVSAAVPNV